MRRERRLQRAVDTINLYGGIMGAAEAAERLGVWGTNLSWQGIRPQWRISRDRIPVYLTADVEALMAAKVQAKRAAASE